MNLEEPEMVIFAGDHSTDAMDMALIYSEIPFKIVKGNTDYYDYDTKDTAALHKAVSKTIFQKQTSKRHQILHFPNLHQIIQDLDFQL